MIDSGEVVTFTLFGIQNSGAGPEIYGCESSRQGNTYTNPRYRSRGQEIAKSWNQRRAPAVGPVASLGAIARPDFRQATTAECP